MSKLDSSKFTSQIIKTLSARAAQICSNPDCNRHTSGPHNDKNKSITIGKAAHIAGQKPGSARYDPKMTTAERGNIDNAIWLCAICHDLIDKDEINYSVNLLKIWKNQHELKIKKEILNTLTTIEQANSLFLVNIKVVKSPFYEDKFLRLF